MRARAAPTDARPDARPREGGSGTGRQARCAAGVVGGSPKRLSSGLEVCRGFAWSTSFLRPDCALASGPLLKQTLHTHRVRSKRTPRSSRDSLCVRVRLAQATLGPGGHAPPSPGHLDTSMHEIFGTSPASESPSGGDLDLEGELAEVMSEEDSSPPMCPSERTEVFRAAYAARRCDQRPPGVAAFPRGEYGVQSVRPVSFVFDGGEGVGSQCSGSSPVLLVEVPAGWQCVRRGRAPLVGSAALCRWLRVSPGVAGGPGAPPRLLFLGARCCR